MAGPQCPGCYGQEWDFVDHTEYLERWPVTRGEIVYTCRRCGRKAIRSWIDAHGTDPDRKTFRDTWEYPEEAG